MQHFKNLDSREKAIDHAITTTTIVETVNTIGVLAFNADITSDHRGIFIDINQHLMLRGEVHRISLKEPRGMRTKFRNTAIKYREGVSGICILVGQILLH